MHLPTKVIIIISKNIKKNIYIKKTLPQKLEMVVSNFSFKQRFLQYGFLKLPSLVTPFNFWFLYALVNSNVDVQQKIFFIYLLDKIIHNELLLLLKNSI